MPLYTISKPPTSSDLSYPLSLSELDNAFGDAPQAIDGLGVQFDPGQGSVKIRRRGDHYAILRASFYFTRCGHVTRGPWWSLYVYGVTRKNRSIVRPKLFEKALPEIAAWLKTPRPQTWLQGRKEITAYFRDRDADLQVKQEED